MPKVIPIRVRTRLTLIITDLYHFCLFSIQLLKNQYIVDKCFFLDQHKVLYHSRHDFREKHSKEHTFIDIINQIQSNFEKVTFTCSIFIELKTAFDTVDHNISLQKLQHYGIRGIVNDWVPHLTDCAQSTLIGSGLSSKIAISCIVSHGSVLSPLLFIYYVFRRLTIFTDLPKH